MRAQDRFMAGNLPPKARGAWGSHTRLGLILLAAQAATLLAMTATVATRVWQDHLWFGFVLFSLTAVAWAPELRLRRERLLWFSYVSGIFLYTLLRALADETVVPIRTDYVIQFDHWLPGRSPVQWLQRLRIEHGIPAVFDFLAIATHWSFFLVPHAGAVLAFVFRRYAFRRYVAMMVGTMWLGLTLFFLLPTTPPWLAGEQGELDGVTRIMDSTIRETLAKPRESGVFPGGASTYDEFYRALGEPNSVAAMPSIHMAVTFAMFLWARRHARRLALPLLLYSLVMAGALVYLGEHYVADELAGVACALLVWLAVRRFVDAEGPAIQAAR